MGDPLGHQQLPRSGQSCAFHQTSPFIRWQFKQLHQTGQGGAALDPGVAEMLSKSATDIAIRQEEKGVPACLLVPDAIRTAMARLLRRSAPRLQVLAHSEIPETHLIRIGPILGEIAS